MICGGSLGAAAPVKTRGVMLVGADLDESPIAYRRLPDVLTEQAHTIKLQHTLRPLRSRWRAAENLTRSKTSQVA
jgi:hypothetical protein